MGMLLCLLNRHEPDRNRVRPADDGSGELTGRCRHCRAQIRRLGHRQWRRGRSAPATQAKLNPGR